MAFPTFAITVDWAGDGSHATAGDDITADVSTLSYGRGASFDGSSEGVGSCIIRVKNIDGKYTPDNASGSLYGNLKPGRKLWVRATYSGTTYALFYGTIRRIILDPASREAEVYAEDPLYDLSRIETNVALSTTRNIKALRGLVLDDAGFAAGQRLLADGIEVNVPTTTADQVDALSVLEALNTGTGTLHFIKPSTTAGTWFAYKTIDRTALQAAAVAEAWDETSVTGWSGYDVNDEAIINSQRVVPTMLAKDDVVSDIWTGGPLNLSASQTAVRWLQFDGYAASMTIAYTATGTASATLVGYGNGAKVTWAGGASGGKLSDITISGYAYRPLDSIGVTYTDTTSAAAAPTGYGPHMGRPIVPLGNIPARTAVGRDGTPVSTLPSANTRAVYHLRSGGDITSPALESDAAAEGLATWIVVRYKDGPPRPTVTKTNAFPSVIAREVGELITWTYPLLSLSAKRFYIRSFYTTIDAQSGLWDTTYTLEAALPAMTLFTLGGSADQGIGGSGILAY